jgi:hypothetical protein
MLKLALVLQFMGEMKTFIRLLIIMLMAFLTGPLHALSITAAVGGAVPAQMGISQAALLASAVFGENPTAEQIQYVRDCYAAGGMLTYGGPQNGACVEAPKQQHQPTEAYLALVNLYNSCKAKGLINDPGHPQCAFAQAPSVTATDMNSTLVGGGMFTNGDFPLVGVNGNIIDADTIEASMNGDHTDDGHTDNHNTNNTQNGTVTNGNAACNNGILSDGCEDGSKRMNCSLVVGRSSPRQTLPVGGALLSLLLFVGLLIIRRHAA